VAAGEEEQNKREGKGFAGLSSLVSDVDTSLPPPAKQETANAGSSSNAERRTASESQQPETQLKQEQPYQAPTQPSSSFSTGKWLLGIAAVIGVFWLIGESNKNSPSPSYTPSAQTQDQQLQGKNRPGQFDPSTARLMEPQAPSRPEESRPPVGQDLVFSTAQIRYCLAEDIRMDGATAAINNYSNSDVDQFNALVADYNNRCSSFRYRSGALESARREVEPYRIQLQAEGRGRFARGPSTDSLSAPTLTRPAPDATVQAIQQKLNELGYNAGPADGLMGGSTRAAIIAFQQDRGLATTGAADQSLLLQLQQAPPSRTPESRPANTSMQLSPSESASLEAACSTDKYVNGPAAYYACVERQRAALATGVNRPNLSSLSAAEQQSIEAACSTDKYVNGPAAYNQCLTSQLAAMSGQGTRRPDLSSLSSPERQSIEATCSTDKYVNGPAAYNRCLNNQLAALERQGERPDLSRLSSTERNSIEAACSTDKYVNGPAAYNRCLSQQLERPIN